MKKNDIYLVIFLTLLSIILLCIGIFNRKNGDRAVIYFNNEEYKTVSLNENKEVNINNTNTVCVKDGKVYMKSANCPDQICVHQVPLDSEGRDIVCLPNKVTVKVISGDKDEVDAVVK